MLNIAICGADSEQNEYIGELINSIIEDEPVRIAAFCNVNAFINYIDKRGYDLNILITDVALGEYNGIKLMRMMQPKLPEIQIIFASKFKEFVFDAYAVRHIAFLPLPIDRDSFANAIMLARENIVFRHRPRVLLTKGGIVCGILLDDIMYMESNGRMITVYTPTSSETFQYKLESIKPSLDARFVHCHKSFIVNMDYASKLDTVNMTFYLRSGIQVPVSTRRVKDVRTAFRDYIMPY